MKNAIEIIKYFESCSYTPYVDHEIVTIGYGHTNKEDITESITEEKAIYLLYQDLKICNEVLDDYLSKIDIKLYEREALISLIFNIGENQFLNSTVYKNILNGDRLKTCFSIIKYVKVFDNVYLGLEKRRLTECALFCGDNNYSDFFTYRQLDFNSVSLNTRSDYYLNISKRLSDLGYKNNLAGIKLFQERNNLISDGILGIKSVAMLIYQGNKNEFVY